jgi:transposase-like protein
MAASRLSDAQKLEIVAAYRRGATAAALASAFGCSPNTVSRVVKTALSPEDYAALKRQRGKGELQGTDDPAPQPAQQPDLQQADLPLEPVAGDALQALDAADGKGDGVGDSDGDGPGVLAIDDADDFSGDFPGEESDPAGSDLEELDADDTSADLADQAPPRAGAQLPVQCRCLSDAQLPATAYLLVDKTVELQPVALSECADLGPLPEEEAQRQALQVYVNPRHAKRVCGRSQRVIPLPDLSLLQRTAPYLLAQGISRVVIEGSLYSLPGS